MEKISLKYILLYLFLINLVTFLAMWIDKIKAKKGHWRIEERTLFILVFLGGGFGGIFGMHLFRHKTKKPRFFIGFPAILITEIIFIILFFLTK